MQETGKRKRAIARAFAKKGSGKILVNKKPLDIVMPEMARLLIKEPLIIGGDAASNLDIQVSVSGGGIFGQATAARQAIAKVLVGQDKKLKEKFLNYDRSLLIADSRRTEPHKPSRSSSGPRRHKQRSKR
ncbi:MAG: 30S ribosomal protein S9 [Candidatus Aenigmarchaeota archaeon]|nr:30S ribosomal protein S9 [Candidatus Aenigmarchaeota archaeon]